MEQSLSMFNEITFDEMLQVDGGAWSWSEFAKDTIKGAAGGAVGGAVAGAAGGAGVGAGPGAVAGGIVGAVGGAAGYLIAGWW
ncbi:Blp family class II bacteriocin [Paenibacillus sp. F6_3S_P_1C]|uniref:Blp family class II bacteriocin n=1 Tax=Paenibacillus vandeheii TaxID=3035917 RepID=A0ABT8J8J7_9BACL|nr:Blp family class II bacteriocin [Paenibacillus vandeheii]MDN4601429.1 Blp family class II bacteriocin [Paenibacillus vandeheii]